MVNNTEYTEVNEQDQKLTLYELFKHHKEQNPTSIQFYKLRVYDK